MPFKGLKQKVWMFKHLFSATVPCKNVGPLFLKSAELKHLLQDGWCLEFFEIWLCFEFAKGQ